MKLKRIYIYISTVLILILVASVSCNEQQANPQAGNNVAARHETTVKKEVYTCAMHPEIQRSQPGSCPVCGMTLIKKESEGSSIADISLEELLRPTNEFVISSVPVTTIAHRKLPVEIEALGTIAYDTRQTGTIASRTSGRIERLYVRYRYQKITKGQRIMDIYSPELMTAQQNLLFILKNDSGNITLIDAARYRLLLLGISEAQVQQVERSGKPLLFVPVYSNYSGHIHETVNSEPMPNASMVSGISMNAEPQTTTHELSLKEGMYLEKGQSVFTVYDPSRLWVLLNLFNESSALVKVGNSVRITPETAPAKNFRAKIDFIEPFYRPESKSLMARVYFNNSKMQLPVGSQVRATVFVNDVVAYWLPQEAILSLGMEKVVFRKDGNGFRAHKVETGMQQANLVQITAGLSPADSVAQNGQYLIDNESFIKTAEQ